MGSNVFYDRIRAMLREELSVLADDPDLIGKRYDRFRALGTSTPEKSASNP